MDRDQLAQRHAAAIRRHYRTLADTGGKPSAELLADLARIADDYSETLIRESHRKALGTSIMPPSEMIPAPAEKVSAPATPAPAKAATASASARTRARTRRSGT